MTVNELQAYWQYAVKMMGKTLETKNADYTGGNDSAFANFERIERNQFLPSEDGVIVRMNDKMARIESLIRNKNYKVKSETIEDTCLDLANYAIILAAILKEKGSNDKK